VAQETRALVHAFGVRHFTDSERRDRLARRHAIAPEHRLADPVEATRAMTVLHATEPPTVHLSVAARTEGVGVEDVEKALYDDRSLVRQLAMRRTLFVFPRDLVAAAWGSASARVAQQEARRVAGDAARSGLAADHDPSGEAWLETACTAVLAALAASDEGLTTAEIRAQVPEVAGTVSISPGTRWGADVPVAPRVMTLLGARGAVIRGRNAGHWRLSRHVWTPTARWLDPVPERLTPEEGYAELVRRWLTTFGPGTTKDVSWWLGSTVTAVKRALADLGAVEVGLDGGGTGWVLPDDLEPGEPVAPWAALLPVLDPTTMGWKERDFYLDPAHTPYLFDTNGNAGTTAWWEGRIVGCWVQDPDGVVQVVPREDVGAEGRAALDVEAARLTDWLGGVRISSVYASHQMKSALLP
jgi:hypothetical protein